MAYDAYLKIEGVPGEATDAKHKEWIEILSYSHGVSQMASSSASTAGGRSSERCDHQDFSIVKSLDAASPKLNLFCCNGKHIGAITVSISRATGDKQQYMEYKLSDVIVSSVQIGGNSGGGDSVPTEQVSFNYGKIEWTYTKTDHKTGKSGGNVASHWDQIENQGG